MCALIIGSGPVGLRCACELALLGVTVRVVESRPRFSRLNCLHLWEWVEGDLAELGIKSLDPSAFSSADFKHGAARARVTRTCVGRGWGWQGRGGYLIRLAD